MRRSGAAIFLLLVLILSPASAQYTPTGVFQTCPNTTAISQLASRKIISGTTGKRTYICALYLVSSPGVLGQNAENFSIVNGTGTTCATGTSVIMGAETAANGMNLQAGVPIVLWSPTVTLWPRAGGPGGDDICLLQSGTGRLAGVVTWVQY